MARDPRVSVRIEAQDSGLSRVVDRQESRLRRFGQFVSTRLVFTITEAANAINAAFAQIDIAARLEGQTEVVRREVRAQGLEYDEFIAKLDEVAQAQISQAKLIEASSKALLLGIPAEDIAALLDVARASAIATGESVSKAFDDIVTGIGRASPLILDNLGIVVKLGDAYAATAAELGKSVEELTAAEQKQSLLNAVLRDGVARVEEFGDAQTQLARSIAQARAEAENAQAAFGRVAGAISSAAVLAAVAAYQELRKAYAQTRVAALDLLSVFTDLSDAQLRQQNIARAVAAGAEAESQRLQALGNDLLAVGLGYAEIEDKAPAAARAIRDFGSATEQSATEVQRAATSVDSLAESFADIEEGTDVAVTGLSAYERAQLSALTVTQRLNQALEQQATQFRGDFARQAAERRSRGRGDPLIIGDPNGPFANLQGGTFTTIRRRTVTADGRVVFR